MKADSIGRIARLELLLSGFNFLLFQASQVTQ